MSAIFQMLFIAVGFVYIWTFGPSVAEFITVMAFGLAGIFMGLFIGMEES